MAPQRPEDGFVRTPEHEFEAILAPAAVNCSGTMHCGSLWWDGLLCRICPLVGRETVSDNGSPDWIDAPQSAFRPYGRSCGTT